jgi:repressor LexA
MFTRDKNRRSKILEFVRQYTDVHGYAPSLREIGGAVGIRSTKAVKYHIDILVQDGLIERVDRKARALRTASRPASLPVIGRIAAGSPVLAIENVESHVSLSRFQDCFLLRVQGESMRDAGIMHGDLVIVRQQNEAYDGDIVAVRIGDEATVKTYHRKKDRIILKPANPDFKPVVLDNKSGDSAIIGIVVGLLRNYK